jgi:transposase
MTLSHSRHEFLYPVISEDATSWLEGHVAAFTFFGGAPRRLVPDYVPRHIIGLLFPATLCARRPSA